MTKPVLDSETVAECRIYIAVSEACWRKENPSYSWHVFDWLCWKQRIRLPLTLKSGFVNMGPTS